MVGRQNDCTPDQLFYYKLLHSAIGLFVLELIEHLCLLPITQFIKLWLVTENVAQTSVTQMVCGPNDCTPDQLFYYKATRVLEQHGSPPRDFSPYWSLPPTEPQKPNTNSCWLRVPRVSTKNLELIAPVFYHVNSEKCYTRTYVRNWPSLYPRVAYWRRDNNDSTKTKLKRNI